METPAQTALFLWQPTQTRERKKCKQDFGRRSKWRENESTVVFLAVCLGFHSGGRKEKLLEVTFLAGSSELCIASLVRIPPLSWLGHPLHWRGSCSADGLLRSATREEASACEHVAHPNTEHLRIRQCYNTQQCIRKRPKLALRKKKEIRISEGSGFQSQPSVCTADRLEAANRCVIDW